MRTRSITLGLLLTSLAATLGTQSIQESFYIPKSSKSPYQMDQPDPTKPPKVYVIPIRGQMGTDIHSSVYKDIVTDVRSKSPDLIIYELDSADVNQRDYLDDDTPNEFGRFDPDDLRVLVRMLKEEFSQIPQVMWVKDSVGFGSLIAFAWPDIFMGSKARLHGLARIMERAGHPDFEVHRKFLAAATAIANGFLESGGYDPKTLGEAMMRKEKKLSVSWEGRKLIWRSDENGTYVVDGSDKAVAGFNSKSAEDLMLSKGTADDLDDLLFLLGYREWDNSLVKGKQDGTPVIEDYIERWRNTYDRSMEAWATYVAEMRNATGEDAVAHLGKARRALQEILDAMNRYPAIEMRWASRQQREGSMVAPPPRLRILDVERLLKELREQIIAAERAKRGLGGGGSGGGSGRGGVGGGGRGPGSR